MVGGIWFRAGALCCAIAQLVTFASESALAAGVPSSTTTAPPAADPLPPGNHMPLIDPLTPANCVDGDEKEIPVCGRVEKLRRICSFPYVTAAMAAEASNHEELREEYHRVNACVSTDPVCAANPDKFGGQEVAEEVERDMGNDMPTKIRFHMSVTDVAIKKARDDMALVSHKGFQRDMVVHYLLFRVVGDSKFNEDAEGINLVAKGVLDREREELLKLAEVLKEMKEMFAQRRDTESEKNTAIYEDIARNRALEVEGASCELGRLAYKNRRIENRHKQITLDAAKETYGQGSPNSPAPDNGSSDITGVKPDPGLPDPGVPDIKIGPPKNDDKNGNVSAVASGGPIAPDNTGSSAPPPSATGASSPLRAPDNDADSLLASFGPDPDSIRRDFNDGLLAPEGIKEEDDKLFDRVKRQYRVRYQHGDFRPSLVD